MKLKELHLVNYRGFENETIEFPKNSNITVLVGKNGSGKSSVLDALATIFVASLEDKLGISFQDTYSLQTEDIKNDSKGGTNIYLRVQIKDTFPEYGQHLLSNIKTDYKPFQSSIPQLYYPAKPFHIDDYFDEENSPQSKSYYDNTFGIDLQSIENFSAWFIEGDNFELRKIKEDNQFRKPELEVVRASIKQFFSILREDVFDNIAVKSTEGRNPRSIETWIEVSKKSQGIRLSQLSAGEQRMILLVADIARRLSESSKKAEPAEKVLNREAIVLIDELELHLHPKWQRNIIPALQQTFPNIQFVVTTHSPQILSNVSKESIIILEDNRVEKKEVFTEGRDSNSILEDVFDVPEVEDRYMEELNHIYHLIDDGNAEKAKAKLNDLIKKRGENDREVVRMASYIDLL